MKALVCEMCNSNDMVKQDGFFVCQSCGTKYTIEEAKKLMVDISGSTVKVDTSDSLENYRQLARRAKEMGNSANAEKYYSLVAMQNPDDWEANFYTVYYASMQTNIAGIASAAIRVANSLPSVMQLIKKENNSAQKSAVKEVQAKCSDLAMILSKSAVSHYNGIDESIRNQYEGELKERQKACRDMMYALGNLIEANFSDNPVCCVQAALAWKTGTVIHESIIKTILGVPYDDELYKYERKIGKYDSNYKAEKINKWISSKITRLEGETKLLNSSEKIKNQFNSSKLPVAIISSVLFCVFIFLFFGNYFRLGIPPVLVVVFGILALVALFVAIVNWKSTFPSAKSRQRTEENILKHKQNIQGLEREIDILKAESQNM